ncbi:MAG: FmdB family zinc ribbon protein [Actinomycetes bacterium]
MPTYEYACSNCESNHEIVQSMSDPTLTTCPSCGQETLRKQFGNVGVVFKGSGFYRNDSRDKKTNTGSSSSSAGSGTSSASSSSPAPSTPAPSTSTPSSTTG